MKPTKEAPDEGIVQFYLDSTHESKKHSNEEYARMKEEIVSTLSEMMINRGGINKKWFVIQPGIYCWQLHIDLLVFQPISLVQIDSLSMAVRAAFADMRLPKINVFFNENTKANDFEMGEELLPLSQFSKSEATELPCVVTLGIVFIVFNTFS